MDYNSENPIYPKLTTYDTRRLHDIQHKLNTITTFLHCTWDVIDEKMPFVVFSNGCVLVRPENLTALQK